MQQLINDYPILVTPLTIPDSLKHISDVCDIEATRDFLFKTQLDHILMKPAFDTWLETNTMTPQVFLTIKEIANLLTVVNRENVDPAVLTETIIRLREILYGDYGLWGCRYGNEIIHGFVDYISLGKASKSPMLRRLILAFENGMPKEFCRPVNV